MSRTDKDAPYWVRAMHHHEDRSALPVSHSPHCEEFRGYRYGGQGFATGPVTTKTRRTTVAAAEANGWRILWTHTGARGVEYCWAVTTVEPQPCNPDAANSGCRRTNLRDRTYWWTDGPTRDDMRLSYFGPERRAVRDSLRDAAKEYRATGDTDVDPPTRQARRSTWSGGWWD